MTPAYRAPRRVPRSVMPRSDRKTLSVRHNKILFLPNGR
jgi:hypothetical protein